MGQEIIPLVLLLYWLQTVSKLSQCYLDRVIKNVYIPKMSSGRRSVGFQSMPECEDKGKNLMVAHKSPKKNKKECFLK